MNTLSDFVNWLQEEVKGPDLPGFIFKILLIDIIYTSFWLLIICLTYGIEPERTGTIHILSWSFPLIILLLAYIEEILFRLPLSLMTKFAPPQMVLYFAIFLSIIFGYLHGGLSNIIVTQGVGGFLMCIVYLKCGGAQGKIIKPLLCSTCMHAAYNMILAYSAALFWGMTHM